jgi:tetratricopeptide (TPR) repeat protein
VRQEHRIAQDGTIDSLAAIPSMISGSRGERAMTRSHLVVLAAVAALCLANPGTACEWDYDTLRQERSRFPTALELITGKFLRHSKEFYEWRIQDRLRRLEKDPNNLALLDDLGVAWQKTGQTDKAIETMERKERIQPGVYETYSNWGTFYILAGDFEKGLPLIDKALEINPDAHFGREKYQKWLVEYAMSRRDEGTPMFPIGWGESRVDRKPSSFSDFLAERLGKKSLNLEDAQPAITGVLGMMRFADHDNPLLLEALADLLLVRPRAPESEDAKLLAARALLLASDRVDVPESKARFRERAESVAAYQARNGSPLNRMPFSEMEAEFKKELADAEVWYADLQAKEREWIAQGLDADAEFDKLYAADPAIPGKTTPEFYVVHPRNRLGVLILVVAGAVVLTVLTGFFLVMRFLWRHLGRETAAAIEPDDKQ